MPARDAHRRRRWPSGFYYSMHAILPAIARDGRCPSECCRALLSASRVILEGSFPCAGSHRRLADGEAIQLFVMVAAAVT